MIATNCTRCGKPAVPYIVLPKVGTAGFSCYCVPCSVVVIEERYQRKPSLVPDGDGAQG